MAKYPIAAFGLVVAVYVSWLLVVGRADRTVLPSASESSQLHQRLEQFAVAPSGTRDAINEVGRRQDAVPVKGISQKRRIVAALPGVEGYGRQHGNVYFSRSAISRSVIYCWGSPKSNTGQLCGDYLWSSA